MSRRTSRVEEAFKEIISEILRDDIKDPRVGFVTITGVKVSPDLRHAKVYFSVIGSPGEEKESLEGLSSAGGYLKHQLGRRMRLRYLPELEFIQDKIAEEAVRLSKIMEETRESRGDED